MSKVLVTGGTGYIGSHTVVELLSAGFEVVIVDSLACSKKEVLKGVKAITNKSPVFEKLDLCNKSELELFLKKHADIDAVIHFAAYKSVPESVDKPLKYYKNNLDSLLNLLEVMQGIGLKNLVFSSSAAVYGEADKLPVNEKSPIKKANCPYGETKQVCEDILRAQAVANHNFKGILLRYFNPIGAHPSVLIGESPIGVPSNLIPFITQTGIGKRQELQVFGDDYNTPDGTCIRDYIHVVDLAKAHVKAVNHLLENKTEDIDIFNLGTGRGVSVLEAITAFENVSGRKLPFKIVNRRKGDVEISYTDTKKANEVLGWKAESSLEDAMKTAWDWELKTEGEE